MKTGKRVILVCSIIFAQQVGAIPVTDPVSYTYYVQQLKQMINTYQQSVKQVTEMIEINKGVRETEEQLKGAYRQSLGLYHELKRAKRIIEDAKGGMGYAARRFARNVDSLIETAKNPEDVPNDQAYTDAKASLDAFFPDPRTTPAHKTDLDRKYYARQSAVRDSIVSADGLLKNMPKNFENIDTLSERIDKTQNIKESQDLTNRLLVEMLKTLNQLLTIDARLTQAMGLMNYKGVSEESTEQRLAKLEEAKNQLQTEDTFIKTLRNKYSSGNMNNYVKAIIENQ